MLSCGSAARLELASWNNLRFWNNHWQALPSDERRRRVNVGAGWGRQLRWHLPTGAGAGCEGPKGALAFRRAWLSTVGGGLADSFSVPGAQNVCMDSVTVVDPCLCVYLHCLPITHTIAHTSTIVMMVVVLTTWFKLVNIGRYLVRFNLLMCLRHCCICIPLKAAGGSAIQMLDSRIKVASIHELCRSIHQLHSVTIWWLFTSHQTL